MFGYLKLLLANSKIRAFIMLIFALAIITSLISYNPSDPSFNLATDAKPSNFLYYIGSYLSDILYQLFGLVSVLIPVVFTSWAYELFRTGKVGWYKTKVLLFTLSVLFVIPIADIFEISTLPSRGGGVVGIGVSSMLRANDGFSVYQYYVYTIAGVIFSILFFLSLGVSFKTYLKFVIALPKFIFKAIILRLFTAKNSQVTADVYHEREQFENLSVRKAPPSIVNDKEGLQEKKQTSPVIVPFTYDAQTKQEEKVTSTTPINHDLPKEHSVQTSQKNLSVRGNVDQSDVLPPLDLLAEVDNQNVKPQTKEELMERSELLLSVLNDFGVKGKILDVREGPVVTMYEFEPSAGTKSSRIIGLADDIARSLSAVSTRIAVIPGRNAIGIELPNKQRMFFRLKELIQTEQFQDKNILLPLILGKDLTGESMVADLAKMPHLLVAGTTGSGKSVAINAMIMSLLYRYTPEECRMIMIDPKMLELSAYDNIPHLMTPVVTEPGKAVVALKWAVKEMENRYRLMSNLGVRNIANYNTKIEEAIKNNQILERKIQTGFDHETGKPIYENVPIEMSKMPFIVVIVDEMADLMLVAGKDIETSIQRLAQMARAAGIHIIMATQRPSVDVITGVIKANFPSRISFRVTSKIDSRTILGEQGAEQLLGMGDMLYMGNSSRILRVHGPFVDDMEVEKVTDFLRTTGTPEYVSAVTESQEELSFSGENFEEGVDADMYTQAVNIVKAERKTSISYIQRCLRIGYNRAANLVEEMERNGILSAPNHSGKREVLLPED